MGVVTMTYFQGIKKYILSISTSTLYPSMTHQFDTYFLEADTITGPWSYVTYMRQFGPEAYFVNHVSIVHSVVMVVHGQPACMGSPASYPMYLMRWVSHCAWLVMCMPCGGSRVPSIMTWPGV